MALLEASRTGRGAPSIKRRHALFHAPHGPAVRQGGQPTFSLALAAVSTKAAAALGYFWLPLAASALPVVALLALLERRARSAV